MPFILILMMSVVAFGSDYLKTDSLTQFSCRTKTSDQKYHFYFAPFKGVEPQRLNSPFVCHNQAQYGESDDALFPRLEQIEGAIKAWPENNILFYDNNSNGNRDVDDAIIEFARKYGAQMPSRLSFFSPLTLPGDHLQHETAGSTKRSSFFTMNPFIDQLTSRSYCPNQTNYDSSNPLFRAIGEVVAVPTEGLYVGERAPETIIDSDGYTTVSKSDFILIRENDLKAVWFYMKDGVLTAPTENNVQTVTTYFYYPINKSQPFVKHANQKTYRVRSPQEMNMELPTSFPTHDRKIACIPKF